MAFSKLQGLGPEKITKIKNELLRGTNCMQLARTIQGDWKDLVGVAEKTLVQMLNRYKQSLIKDGVGDQHKSLMKTEGGKLNLKLLRGTSISVLQHLVALAEMQEQRIQVAWEKEQAMGGIPLGALNVLVKEYKEMLLDIQKVQFDLGIDEFKGVLLGGKMMQETIKNPDGTVQQRTIVQALTSLDEVFKKRGIYVPQAGQLGSGADNSQA